MRARSCLSVRARPRLRSGRRFGQDRASHKKLSAVALAARDIEHTLADGDTCLLPAIEDHGSPDPMLKAESLQLLLMSPENVIAFACHKRTSLMERAMPNNYSPLFRQRIRFVVGRRAATSTPCRKIISCQPSWRQERKALHQSGSQLSRGCFPQKANRRRAGSSRHLPPGVNRNRHRPRKEFLQRQLFGR